MHVGIWLRRIVQSTVLAATVIAAVELTTRIDDWARFDVPISSNIVSLDGLITLDSVGMHARAGSQFRKFSINSLGFRGPEIDSTTLSSAALIVVSGASESFGLYESPGKEWPRQFEDSLAGQCSRPVYVANAAFAGMALPTVMQDVQLRLAKLRPQVIVYYPTPMQYLEASPPVAAQPAATPIAEDAGFQFRAVSRFRDAIKAVIPSLVLDWLRRRDIHSTRQSANIVALQTVPGDRLDWYENGLRALVGTIRSIGAVPVLVVHQNRFAVKEGRDQEIWLRAWERFHPAFSGSAIVEFDRASALRTLKVGRDSSVVVVDPTETIARERPAPFADYAHFSDRGAAIIGAAVAGSVKPLICPP
jgi:hypothetical protein